MLSFFSKKSAYEEIKTIETKVPPREYVNKQLAAIRMQDVERAMSYYLIDIQRTYEALVYIFNALETTSIQNEAAYLETLSNHLYTIKDRLTYYKSPESNGIYKWMFWSSSNYDITQLISQTHGLLNKTTLLQNKLSPHLSYQQSAQSA